MLKVLRRKLNLLTLSLALLLVAHGVFPNFAQATELNPASNGISIAQRFHINGINALSTTGLLAEAVVEAPAVDEAAAKAVKEAEKAEAKKLKEAEKAAKKVAKAEAKRLEDEQEAAEEAAAAAAKAEAKAAKKAAKEAAKKEKEATKAAAKVTTEDQAIAPIAEPSEQVADASEATKVPDFASFTPEQKREYFMGKKGSFKPSAEAIANKVSNGMKMKGASMPPGVSEKINAKMKGKEGFIPTPEAISKKISDGMKMAKSKLEDVMDSE